MACRRCSTCGINYPSWRANSCKKCGGETSYFSDLEPDADWEEAESGETYNLRTPLPIPNCEHAVVVKEFERLWIAHKDLLRDGYACIETFDVVQVAGKFYELQGHVGKDAKNMPGGAWWVEEIDPEKWATRALGKLPVLTHVEYVALEKARAAS